MCKAIQYSIDNGHDSVTLVHKGNIQKFTEVAFRNWGYELAERDYGDHTYTWDQWDRTMVEKGQDAANAEQEAALGAGKILVKDAIADITLQQVLTRPKEFDVIATMNQPPTRPFSKLPIVGTWPVAIHRQATRIVCSARPAATP